MLYTIVPTEVIFAEGESEVEGSQNNASEQLVEIEGATLLVEPDGTGRGRIKRIISTDPNHYLDPRWQPGMKIRW
ncbi:MAG TPA: YlzJ-like family protein [Bacillota bacterium]|nr:YlzJ-like family protein [Bacillota bacterium]